MMALAIAGLIFLAIVVLVVGLWWVAQAERTVRARIKRPGRAGGPASATATPSRRARLIAYMAPSAARKRTSGSATSGGAVAMPMLAVSVVMSTSSRQRTLTATISAPPGA